MSSFRSVPRYFLLPPAAARYADYAVSVIDVSLKGARMEIQRPLPLGTRQLLSIETAGKAIAVPATVLWCELDDLSLAEPNSDRYVAGLVFDECSEAMGELIERMLKAGMVIPIEDARTADRFTINSRLTGTFGSGSPVGIMDISIRGVKMATNEFLRVGSKGSLRFQIDSETGPLEVEGTVMWCLGAVDAGFEAGLKIEGHEDVLRVGIHRLCMRDEARIDLHSLRRRFDSMRTLSHQYQMRAAT